MCVQAELQEHSFFAPINWDDLLARKLRPPFIPNVVGKTRKPIGPIFFFFAWVHTVSSCVAPLQTGPCDISYIDPEFTLQPVPDSVNEKSPVGSTSEAFPGFSFMNPAEYVVS